MKNAGDIFKATFFANFEDTSFELLILEGINICWFHSGEPKGYSKSIEE